MPAGTTMTALPAGVTAAGRSPAAPGSGAGVDHGGSAAAVAAGTSTAAAARTRRRRDRSIVGSTLEVGNGFIIKTTPRPDRLHRRP
jgi:hypothetical protein